MTDRQIKSVSWVMLFCLSLSLDRSFVSVTVSVPVSVSVSLSASWDSSISTNSAIHLISSHLDLAYHLLHVTLL